MRFIKNVRHKGGIITDIRRKKEMRELISNIRTTRSVLFLGQKYFTVDSSYFDLVKRELVNNGFPEKIREYQSFESLRKEIRKDKDKLKLFGEQMKKAGEHAVVQPWLRAVLSMGWNVMMTSSPNKEWFGKYLDDSVRDEVKASLSSYNKKHRELCCLAGNENTLFEQRKRDLPGLKESGIINEAIDSYGYIVFDGIADDDWLRLSALSSESMNPGCVYIFGMTKDRAEKLIADEEKYDTFEKCVDNGQIILIKGSLEEIVKELGLDDEQDDEENVYENAVRVTLPGTETKLMIDRRVCTDLSNIGITLMRDEIFSTLILDNVNKEECFADFLMQKERINWGYYQIMMHGTRTSFHCRREVEDRLIIKVKDQLAKSSDNRQIVLLSGPSNSGKSTSLSWLAWKAAKEGLYSEKKDKERKKYCVFYISGDPSRYDSDWKNTFAQLIKDGVYDRDAPNGKKVRLSIVIWDNYSNSNKISEYAALYNALADCNVVLVGSSYLESSLFTAVQGVSFVDIPISSRLERTASDDFKALARNCLGRSVVNSSDDLVNNRQVHLFEFLTMTKFNYLPKWREIRDLLERKLTAEAEDTEKKADELWKRFEGKNPESFEDVSSFILSLGIGASEQTRSDDRKLINSISLMNRLLAVAGQFKTPVKLPLPLLLNVILADKNKEFRGAQQKLMRILRTDSMVSYESSAETGRIRVSFRNPGEACAYIKNIDLEESERREKEIQTLMLLIEHCHWDRKEESTAVCALIRSFGPNSKGKWGDTNSNNGNYSEYSAYWKKIAEKLLEKAENYPDPVLIAAHFIRESVSRENDAWNERHDELMKELVDVYEMMSRLDLLRSEGGSKQEHFTRSMLYGEMCSNLLQQKNRSGCDISGDFESGYRNALEEWYLAELKDRSPISLLDIWLNYYGSLTDEKISAKLLLITLQRIDTLLYNENSLAWDADYTNVVDKIYKLYSAIEQEEEKERLCEFFKNAENDSYVYFLARSELSKVYLKFANDPKYSELWGSGTGSGDKTPKKPRISSRIFFLSENASADFLDGSGWDDLSFKPDVVFKEVKEALRGACENIVSLFEKEEYRELARKSCRCMLMYMKAKWLLYTGDLMMEKEQMVCLNNDQWQEMRKIISSIESPQDKTEIPKSSAVSFIKNIYLYAFTNEGTDFPRGFDERSFRTICLCDFESKKPLTVELKDIGFDERGMKLSANIKNVYANGAEVPNIPLIGRKVFVPDSALPYRDVRNGKKSSGARYEIWFNLGGALVRKSGEEV